MKPWKTDFIDGTPRLAADHGGGGPVLVFLHGIGGNRISADIHGLDRHENRPGNCYILSLFVRWCPW